MKPKHDIGWTQCRSCIHHDKERTFSHWVVCRYITEDMIIAMTPFGCEYYEEVLDKQPRLVYNYDEWEEI